MPERTDPDCPRSDAYTHGTVYAYAAGCRCPEAIEANLIRSRRQKRPGYKRPPRPKPPVPEPDELTIVMFMQGAYDGRRVLVSERREGVRRLAADGLDANEIAARTNTAIHTVERDLHVLAVGAAGAARTGT